ncbi:protein of unknown function [Candidatus Filomicrobium marinum]|uniref:Uncharacterized protein n=1 Tax=Candidatus Filomicrobium marinum TaxID=1608628 RepID=A0A0D6JIV8_9HYPH|nr:protein of unknown function [Candidatus Filomicrobium marinum]CPR21355.1 protein of unknown function [Candidatus Filomicrobium marinum]
MCLRRIRKLPGGWAFSMRIGHPWAQRLCSLRPTRRASRIRVFCFSLKSGKSLTVRFGVRRVGKSVSTLPEARYQLRDPEALNIRWAPRRFISAQPHFVGSRLKRRHESTHQDYTQKRRSRSARQGD